MADSLNEMAAAHSWAEMLARHDGFSFTYGGAPVGGALRSWQSHEQRAHDGEAFARVTTTATDPATSLEVRVEANVHSDFPAVEWVLHLRNASDSDTPLIEGLLPLDAALPLPAGAACTVRHSKGALCSPEDFEVQERALRPRGELRLHPGGGRSSSEVLPFFNVMWGGRGAVLAIGWTGEWAACFSRTEEGTLQVRAGMERTRFVLHPGEEVRTPRILMLFWEGDSMRGHNLLRRFLLEHDRPRPHGEPLVAPLCNGNWGGTPADVHEENVRRIAEEGLPFEYYWIDAEWFGRAGHWMENAGHWEPRKDLYPQGFRPISDALHRAGRKLLLWFEPERVAPGTPWFEELKPWLLDVPREQAITWSDYGEHLSPAEWVKMESARNQLNAGDRLLDLGNPEARRFLTEFLSARITEFGIDCLRWDSNIAQIAYWRHADAQDRQGVTEIRYVEGQYALWDELLRRHPGLIIDNCASGGRRIDLESIGRATPLWRTDYSVGHRDPIAAQCHTLGLLHWVPLNGVGGGYLKDWDNYTLRSNMSAALVVGLWGQGDARQERIPDDYPFAHARALLEQYLAVRRFYHGDFYPLTQYTRASDAWMAYQLHLPDTGEGLVVVLKRPQSPFTRATFPLQALEPGQEYEFRDWDTSRPWAVTGRAAMEEGLPVELAGRPDSALILYRRMPWEGVGCGEGLSR